MLDNIASRIYTTIMSVNLNSQESKIITLLKQRDQQGLVLAYRHYGNAVYGIIFRILKSEDIAQEVLQDVFIKVWDRIDNYDSSKGKFFTWLVTIARRMAIDHTRGARFKQEEKTDAINYSVYSNKWSEEAKVKDVGLENVINSLDEKYRLLIDLVYFKGYTHQEVHEETNIPLGTIKTRLRTAINELRKMLGDASITTIITVTVVCMADLWV